MNLPPDTTASRPPHQRYNTAKYFTALYAILLHCKFVSLGHLPFLPSFPEFESDSYLFLFVACVNFDILFYVLLGQIWYIVNPCFHSKNPFTTAVWCEFRLFLP